MTVVLSGRRDGTTHREVELLGSLPPELRLIGGLAVMARVGSPHRATVDLDTVARHLDRHHAALSRMALPAETGGQYTFVGDLDLDVIDDAGRDRTYREVRRFDEPRLDFDRAEDVVEQILTLVR